MNKCFHASLCSLNHSAGILSGIDHPDSELDGMGKAMMLRAITEQGRLFLTAEFLARDGRTTQASAKLNFSKIENLQRFPPIEDLVSSLDSIASGAIAT